MNSSANKFDNLDMNQFFKNTTSQNSQQKKQTIGTDISIKEIILIIVFQNRKDQAQIGSLVKSPKYLGRNHTNFLQFILEDRRVRPALF